MLKMNGLCLECGGTPILNDIGVEFATGELTTVIGPNGCGKTTLVQSLNGASRVTSGSIEIDGEDYLALKPRKRARRLSFLPQVRRIIPQLTVADLVSYGRFPSRGFAGRPSENDLAIIEKAMVRADVAQYGGQTADTLSGGVRQRAFVAMQLAQDCDHIVADEPTTYLDIPSRNRILKIYSDLRDEGKTVILVLHDIAKALEISDRIVVMDARRIVAEGSPSQLLESGIIDSIFGVSIRHFSDGDGDYYVC